MTEKTKFSEIRREMTNRQCKKIEGYIRTFDDMQVMITEQKETDYKKIVIIYNESEMTIRTDTKWSPFSIETEGSMNAYVLQTTLEKLQKLRHYTLVKEEIE